MDRPKSPGDSWRPTPSLLDSPSIEFSLLASQLPVYYATTSSESPAMSYHNQVGPLDTTNTAISLPMTADAARIAHSATDTNRSQHPFDLPQTVDQFTQPDSFSPSTFVFQGWGYSALDLSEEPPGRTLHIDRPSLGAPSPGAGLSENWEAHIAPGDGNFRFNVMLRAATSMTKDAKEIPVTYLNKGQAYTITVADRISQTPGYQPLRYRTYIRISFEDDDQRSNPATCWQLWMNGRGLSQAHQHDGKLLAVEYVGPQTSQDLEAQRQPIWLEKACFDGFCVNWIPSMITGSSSCDISVRFNFVSTDFSYFKGIKGIPVRLCVKTEVLSSGTVNFALHNQPEVCYCKVKVFKDHGAERRLSNDVAHVKKMIDKLRQQISQVEIDLGHFDKRDRSPSTTSKLSGDESTKRSKRKRNSSGNWTPMEDLHRKLVNLQKMFSSTRPISSLNLKGDPEDDPDLFPVYLSNAEPQANALDSLLHRVVQESSGLSPKFHASCTITSGNSSGLSRGRPSIDLCDSDDWPSVSQQDLDDRPARVRKLSSQSSDTGFSEKPTACFYVKIQQTKSQKSDGHYHAIYLRQRTAKDLIHAIVNKCSFDPRCILSALWVRANGLNVVVDDEVVGKIPEGQDMVVEFSELSSNSGQSASGRNSISSTVMKLAF